MRTVRMIRRDGPWGNTVEVTVEAYESASGNEITRVNSRDCHITVYVRGGKRAERCIACGMSNREGLEVSYPSILVTMCRSCAGGLLDTAHVALEETAERG